MVKPLPPVSAWPPASTTISPKSNGLGTNENVPVERTLWILSPSIRYESP